MIEIKVTKGIPYIWDPKDWLRLRTEHRIVGALDGVATAKSKWNMPMRLSDVEVQYLVTHNIATTVHAPSLYEPDPVIDASLVTKLKEQRREFYLQEHRKKKKEEILTHIDKMIEGKRRKGKLVDVDRNTFIKNELDKITAPPEMYQLDISDPWLTKSDYIPYNYPAPQSYVEKLRYRVFEDFHHNKNFFVTPGIKFGGDFLAYPGDPTNFHAQFVIMCPDKKEFYEKQITSQLRLSLTVKKTLLIAKLDEQTDKLLYYFPTTNFVS